MVHHGNTPVANTAVMGAIELQSRTSKALYRDVIAIRIDLALATRTNNYDRQVVKYTHKAEEVAQINKHLIKSWKIL